jgi:hypothetical protein
MIDGDLGKPDLPSKQGPGKHYLRSATMHRKAGAHLRDLTAEK